MNFKFIAAKNAGSNYLFLGVNIAVGFFLSPFILHKLGEEAFGLWILIFSLTGYYGLFDFGIRSSILKYVAEFTATRDHHQLTCCVNTGLFVYSFIALFLLVVTGLASWRIDSIVHISPASRGTFRLLMLMVGSAIALGFPLGVFEGVLEGLQQFWWSNCTAAISTLLRAVLIVTALEYGYGILTVAFITVALPVLGGGVYLVVVNRLTRMRYGIRFVDRTSFLRMISFGLITFVAGVAEQLRFRSDAIVIGIFLSASAITYYSIGSKLVDYSSGLVQSLASVFTPMSSHLNATGDAVRLQKVFVFGNRACAMIAFPICAGFIILGKPLITLWVGPKYVSSGYLILLFLIVPRTCELAQAVSSKILFGMAQHRKLAIVRVVEALVNLILSIVLVHFFGITGVALGTAIPLLCTNVFFLPQHLCRLLNIRLSTFVTRAYLPPLGLCAPMVALLLVLRHLSYARTYTQLFIQVTAGGLVYCVGLLWFVFTKDQMGIHLRTRLAQYLQQAMGR